MKSPNSKPRRFYPRQALRRLHGELEKLSPSQRAALRFLLLRSRKLGYAIEVLPRAGVAHLQACTEPEAKTVLANTTRIILTPAV